MPEDFRTDSEVKVKTCKMFVKLILLVSMMFTFVCVRSIENEVQHLSLFSSIHPDSITDAESVVTDGRCVLPPTTHASINIPPNHHKIMNSDMARLKKRTPSHKEQDQQQDLRPGCCG